MEVLLIESQSEISAGTRGSSLGAQAMKVAAWKQESDFFERHRSIRLPHQNHLLTQPWYQNPEEKSIFQWAKRIDGLIRHFEEVIPVLRDTFAAGNTFPFILGSAHGETAGALKAMKAAHPTKRIGVIWIDAHGDLHSPLTTPSGNMHGMPLAMVLGADNEAERRRELPKETMAYWEELKEMGSSGPAIKPEDIVLIAARDLEVQERKLMDELGITNIPVRTVREDGAHKAVDWTMKHLQHCDIIYVSFDVDSLDANVSVGTGTPVIGGLIPTEARFLMMLLAREPKVQCMEIVEINPTLDDKGNKMAEVALDILEHVVEIIEATR